MFGAGNVLFVSPLGTILLHAIEGSRYSMLSIHHGYLVNPNLRSQTVLPLACPVTYSEARMSWSLYSSRVQKHP